MTWFDRAYLDSCFTSSPRKPKTKPQPATRRWLYNGMTVKAWTKSEARAMFKDGRHGLPNHARIREILP